MDHQHVHPPAGDVEMGHPLAVYRPTPTPHGQAMNQQQLRAHGPNSWECDVEMGHHPVVPPPVPTTRGQAMNQQQLGAHGPNNWVGNDRSALLVGAVLITLLTYHVGTNIPGGYWQETTWQDGKLLYRAGDPIMRALHRPRYWVFTVVSWVGFGSSMVLTLSLLVGLAVNSRHVRWSFAVAYSSLVLTFIVSQTRSHLSLAFLTWLAVLAIIWLIISVRPEHRTRIIQALCCSHHN